MKHVSTFDAFLNESVSPDKYPALAQVIEKLWDGDVSFDEAVENFTPVDLDNMEETIEHNLEVFADGVPWPSENPDYAALLKTDNGAKLIQKMINKQEG